VVGKTGVICVDKGRLWFAKKGGGAEKGEEVLRSIKKRSSWAQRYKKKREAGCGFKKGKCVRRQGKHELRG